MKYLSKVASMVCIAGVAVTLVGCGGSSTPPPADGEGSCAIPDSVKQNLIVDQQTARAITRLAIDSSVIGWKIGDVFLFEEGGLHKSDSKIKTLSVKSDALNPIDKRAGEVVNSVEPLKEIWINNDAEMGDDLACDEGTYSLHYDVKEGGTEEDDVYTEEFALNLVASFNNCILYEGSEKDKELNELFESILMNNSIINKFGFYSEEEDDNITLSLNGSSTLDIDWVASHSGNGSDDSWINIDKLTGSVSIDNKNIFVTVDSIKDGRLFTYSSDGLVSVDLKVQTDEDGTKVIGEDGNTTTTNAQIAGSFDVGMNVREFMQKGSGDNYRKRDLKAYCYTHDTTWTEKAHTFLYEDNEDDANDIERKSSDGQAKVLVNGYGSVFYMHSNHDGIRQEFYDLYNDKLDTQVSWVNRYVAEKDTHIDDQNQTVDINGRVGSTALGGSAMVTTIDSWEDSNKYPVSRNDDVEGYSYITYTPYKGQSIITGVNQGLVGFDYEYDDEDTRNETYGYIQVDSQEAVEYDSLSELVDAW